MAAPSFAEPIVQNLTQDLDLSSEALVRVLDLAAVIPFGLHRVSSTVCGIPPAIQSDPDPGTAEMPRAWNWPKGGIARFPATHWVPFQWV